MQLLNKNFFYLIGVLLGVALGSGHLTSLRFLGKVGASEILFLFVLVFLLGKYVKKIFSFKRNLESVFRAYLYFSIFLVAPIVTLIVSAPSSSPIHMISFSMSMLLVFSIIQARLEGFDLKNAVLWFLIVFFVANIIALYVYPLENIRFDGFRYTGGAKNPNQIVYYSQSLTLLLVVFFNRAALLFIPFIVFLSFKTKSDAYILSIFLSVLLYIFLKVFYLRRYSFSVNFFIYIFPILLIALLIVSKYQDELIRIWIDAGGVARGGLYLNAIEVIKESPLFGFGFGTFSGKAVPFEGTEAHSNPLDLAIQFGVLFACLIYYVLFKAVVISIRRNDYLIASFMVAYIVTGLFHYTARHFVFWVEFSVFYYYVFYQKKGGLVNEKKSI
mgnify:FL=1